MNDGTCSLKDRKRKVKFYWRRIFVRAKNSVFLRLLTDGKRNGRELCFQHVLRKHFNFTAFAMKRRATEIKSLQEDSIVGGENLCNFMSELSFHFFPVCLSLARRRERERSRYLFDR